MKPQGSLPKLHKFASGPYQQPPPLKTSLRSICLTSCSAQVVQSPRWLCAEEDDDGDNYSEKTLHFFLSPRRHVPENIPSYAKSACCICPNSSRIFRQTYDLCCFTS